MPNHDFYDDPLGTFTELLTTTPKRYTLLAYKPEHSEYCMGNFMESHASDFRWLTTDSEQELTEFWAWTLNMQRRGRSNGDCNYEFKFLLNGKEDGWECSAEYQRLQHNAEQLAEHLFEESEKARKVAEEKTKAEAVEKAKADKEARDRRDYERLKAKFEGQHDQ